MSAMAIGRFVIAVEITQKTAYDNTIRRLVIPAWLISPFLRRIKCQSKFKREVYFELQNGSEAKIIFDRCDYNAFWVGFRHQYPTKLFHLPI